jgi:hypothetical protein
MQLVIIGYTVSVVSFRMARRNGKTAEIMEVLGLTDDGNIANFSDLFLTREAAREAISAAKKDLKGDAQFGAASYHITMVQGVPRIPRLSSLCHAN